MGPVNAMASSKAISPKKLQQDLLGEDSQSLSTSYGGGSASSGGSVATLSHQEKTRLTMDGRFQCSKCVKVYMVADMSQSRAGVCGRCHSAYNGLQKRWNQNRKLRSWWNEQTKEQQINWFQKQHDVPVGAKRKFDLLQYSEQATKSAFRSEADVDRFVPWSVFRREGLACGRSEQELEKEFQDRVDDPTCEAVQRRGQWLVPVYEGMERRTGEESKQAMTAMRTAVVVNNDQLVQLQHGGGALRSQFLESCEQTKTGKDLEKSGWVQGQVSDQPVMNAPMDVISKAVAREALITQIACKASCSHI